MKKSDMLLKEMGKRIRDRRDEMKMSQETLAEIADISPQMVSTAERGVKSILSENLFKISKALGVSMDYLLTGDFTEKDLSEITKKLEGVSAEQVKKIEQIINNCIDLCN